MGGIFSSLIDEKSVNNFLGKNLFKSKAAKEGCELVKNT